MSLHACTPYGAGNEQTPLVTAIVVTRNQEAFIRESLLGLFEQTVADRMEVIVLDEGSQQAETAIVAELQRGHGNVISLRTSGRGGVDLALRIASGRFVTLLDATDRMKHDAFELMAAALQQDPAAMLAYGDTCITAIPHETFASHTSYGKMIWPDYTAQQLGHLTQVAPHPLWRRELHEAVGGFNAYGQEGMRDFLQRVAARHPMIHLREFTGLTLITAKAAAPARAAAALPQSSPQALKQPATPHPEPLQQAAPEPAMQQPAAELWTCHGQPEAMQPAVQPETVIPHPQPQPFHAAPVFAAPAVEAAPAASGAREAFEAIRPLVEAGRLEEAAQALEKYLEAHPEDAVAHNDLAAIGYQLGDADKALAHYREAARLAPEDATFRKNLADILYVAAGEVDEAISIYLDLLKQSPRDVETLLNLGIISDQLDQPEEAESFLQRALEIEPWNQGVREYLGAMRARRAEPEAAEDEDEETAEERYERCHALVARGDVAGATRELQGILEVYPDFAPAHNDLAVLRYQNGDKEGALKHHEKAAALAPGNSTFQKNLADFYFVEGHDIDGAIAIYLKLLEKEPKDVETLMSLGKICTVLDRPQEAETFYGKVTQLEPWNQDARECLSTLRQCANG